MPATMFDTEEAIYRIGRGLMDRSLPKAEWTHAAHFAAALWLMRHHPEIDPARAMPGLIRAYNEATGVANTDAEGYHETITIASLRAARAWLVRWPASTPLYQILNALTLSPLGRSDWLLAHWSREILFSVEARRGWLEPDLSPLPF